MTISKILSREFILVFLAQFTLSIVFCIFVPTLPIYLARMGSTEVEIGLLIGVLGFSSLILRPFVGKALSTFPERTFLMLGALLFSLTSAAYLFVPLFWPLLFVRVIQGVGVAFFYTASVALAAGIGPEEHRGQSLTYFYTAFNIAFALGPSLGMFLINAFGFIPLFGTCTVLSLCCLVIASRLEKKIRRPVERRSLRDGALFSREALPPSLISLFAHIIWGAIGAFFPLYALGCGVSNPGLFFAVFSIVLILGRTLGAAVPDRYDREKVMLPCLCAYVVAMVLLSFSRSLPMFFLVAVIWGTGSAFLFPVLVLSVLDRAGSARGAALGTYTAVQDFGTAMGPVLMGLILKMTNYPTMFLSLALIGSMNIGVYYFFVRKVR